jgi:putative hydrolase of the HAD superfamily
MQIEIKSGEIKAIFLDIGGVLLTNGWDYNSRVLGAKHFGLDQSEMETRHDSIFNTYEIGKVTLDEYLELVVFHQKRSFTPKEFKAFMFERSQALDGHIDFFKEVKHKHQLKVIAVSNEGRELNEHRIRKFKLDELFDAYVSSCYVHLHKPSKEMLWMASDLAHVPPENALYVDDSGLLADLARMLGFHSMQFQGLDQARTFIKTCTFYQPTQKK